jgi:CRP/FNR family cyclic AMP-dependent transcriptional regulator
MRSRHGGRVGTLGVGSATVRLLDHDPDLAVGLDRERLAEARRDVSVATLEFPRGPWRERVWPAQLRHGLGLLVLDGLLLRRVKLDGRFSAELVGRGDLLRPWQQDDAFASVSYTWDGRVLERSRLARLDLDFARRVSHYPELQAQLLARALSRARRLAINLAIIHQPRVEKRLHMLLWHLADYWGTVRADGVYLPTKLTHAVLSELIAAQRPGERGARGAAARWPCDRSARGLDAAWRAARGVARRWRR